MDEKTKYLLLKTVQDDNILPLTSVCNMNCLFCSHRNNPAGLQVYRFGHLPLELLEELIDFLSPGEPVIIGESATRIIEGEPLLHPHFTTVLKLLRKEWPDKTIRLTTNGSLLTREMVDFLSRLSPVELNISVNCANPEERVFLMSDRQAGVVFQGLGLLQEKGLDFSGSIVAVPHILGWESLEETISRLAEFNPQTVRVFLPGFTKYSVQELKFEPAALYQRLSAQVEELQKKYNFPILLEPPFLEDFKARIKGVIPGSPAASLPLKQGDLVLKVNNRPVKTRVDCFHRLLNTANPSVEVLTGERKEHFTVTIKKGREERPGIILNYDLAPETLEKIEMILAKKMREEDTEMEQVVLVTGSFAGRLIEDLAAKLQQRFSRYCFEVLIVKNRFFGGSIGTAGLLTNQDILTAFEERPDLRPGLIFLPGIIYDIFGKDLTGKDYRFLSRKLNGEVIVI